MTKDDVLAFLKILWSDKNAIVLDDRWHTPLTKDDLAVVKSELEALLKIDFNVLDREKRIPKAMRKANPESTLATTYRPFKATWQAPLTSHLSQLTTEHTLISFFTNVSDEAGNNEISQRLEAYTANHEKILAEAKKQAAIQAIVESIQSVELCIEMYMDGDSNFVRTAILIFPLLKDPDTLCAWVYQLLKTGKVTFEQLNAMGVANTLKTAIARQQKPHFVDALKKDFSIVHDWLYACDEYQVVQLAPFSAENLTTLQLEKLYQAFGDNFLAFAFQLSAKIHPDKLAHWISRIDRLVGSEGSFYEKTLTLFLAEFAKISDANKDAYEGMFIRYNRLDSRQVLKKTLAKESEKLFEKKLIEQGNYLVLIDRYNHDYAPKKTYFSRIQTEGLDLFDVHSFTAELVKRAWDIHKTKFKISDIINHTIQEFNGLSVRQKAIKQVFDVASENQRQILFLQGNPLKKQLQALLTFKTPHKEEMISAILIWHCERHLKDQVWTDGLQPQIVSLCEQHKAVGEEGWQALLEEIRDVSLHAVEDEVLPAACHRHISPEHHALLDAKIGILTTLLKDAHPALIKQQSEIALEAIDLWRQAPARQDLKDNMVEQLTKAYTMTQNSVLKRALYNIGLILLTAGIAIPFLVVHRLVVGRWAFMQDTSISKAGRAVHKAVDTACLNLVDENSDHEQLQP